MLERPERSLLQETSLACELAPLKKAHQQLLPRRMLLRISIQ